MKKHLFRFKQFSLVQEKSAMKIGTDGVLLGAWADFENPKMILDIGAGTGLISLMLAQRFSESKIIGIEIDNEAAQEAQMNVENSPFHQRCTIVNYSLQIFETDLKFDLIVSNPPFFESNPKETSSRITARQQTQLSFEELIYFSEKFLSENGICTFVIPFDLHRKLIEISAKSHLFPTKIIHVKGNENAPFKRTLIAFSRRIQVYELGELIIEKERHIYTDDYVNLTQDFYLKM